MNRKQTCNLQRKGAEGSNDISERLRVKGYNLTNKLLNLKLEVKIDIIYICGKIISKR